MLAVALHRQLLEVGREALQVLLVGQDRDGLRAEEVVVPDAEQAHQHRQVALERRGAEVLVHLRGSRRASRGSCPGRWRASSRGRSPSPSSSGRRPSPRTRTCWRCRCRTSATFAALVETATKCLATAFASPPRPASDQSRARVGVGHRLQRGEGLRRDDEQRLRRVEVARRLGEVGAVDVGDEAEGHGAVAVVLERLVGHHRAEVRAADADVDDVADALAGVALPRAAADAVGEVGHLVEHGVDLGHHVLAVDDDRRALGRAQRHVQDGAVLGDVDLLAPEHGVDPLAQAGLLGQLQQELERLVGDAILRVVEVEPDRLGRQPLAALGVVGEELRGDAARGSSRGGLRGPSRPGVR